MKRNHLIALVVLVVAGLFALAALVFNSKSSPSPTARIAKEDLVKPYSPSLGNPEAKVTVVEFLDPECGTCAALSPMVKGLVSDYKDRIHFVVRYMLFHQNSRLAALATEAAGKQGKYWEMQAQLFFRREWAEKEEAQTAFFEKVATELGLNLTQYRNDLKDQQTLEHILADYQEGPRLGVAGTPTFFVNGRIVPGLSYEEIKKAIDQELQANP